MKKRYLLLVLLLPAMYFSQTAEEKKIIADQSNKVANAKLLQELQQNENAREVRIANYLAQNPTARAILKDDESGKLELMDVLPNGEKIYAETDNAGAAITAGANKLYSGGSLGINVQGQGMTAGVWDGANVRTTHQEFMVGGVSKVQNMDGVVLGDHATHVTGTIAAQGIVPAVRGIAFNASVKSYTWTNDLTEMLTEASTGLLNSNHSYGFGQLSSIWFFGAYDARAKQMDEICYNNPYYLPVVSAGNSRNDNTPPASTQIADKSGYDLIFGHGNAKNVMTVAAVNQVDNYVGSASVAMSQFSSYGPSDDGRIKPDISMKGVGVNSTVSTSNTATAIMQGTSMASPGVTGVVTLLQQYYNQLYTSYMRAATVKGLILHSAKEAGFFPGPDNKFGWGLIDAEAAAKAIRDKATTTNGSFIQERVLNNGGTYSKTFTASGPEPLRVSISWTDPQYPTENSGTTDPDTVYLVNDLDLKVVSTGGTTYYPWKSQGMANPSGNASNNSTNDADNFERVDVYNPSGEYTATVTHKGTLVPSQAYSLIITSGGLSYLSTQENTKNKTSFVVFPNPVKDVLNILGYKDGAATIFDQNGRVVLKGELANGAINVHALTPGNYILKLEDKSGNTDSIKFIKK